MSEPLELPVISREEWGAVPPRSTKPLQHPIRYIRITDYPSYNPCEKTSECKKICRELQTFEMQNQGWPDIQPNFLLGKDYRIYEGRGWDTKPDSNTYYHEYDGKLLQIAYIGKFKEDGQPEEKIRDMIDDIIFYGKDAKIMAEDVEIVDHRKKKE